MNVCTETDDFMHQVDQEVVFITKLCNLLWLVCDTVEGSQGVTMSTDFNLTVATIRKC